MPLPTPFIAKKILSAVLVPPLLPIVIILVGWLVAVRRKGSGLAIIALGMAVMLALSTPLTVHLLVAPLEAYRPITPDELRRAQAIVILGGGQRREAIEYAGPAPNRLTLERLRYGARLARQSKLPVLVSGGAPTGERPEAEVMADALGADFGIQVKWIERASLDTRDNGRFSAAMLKYSGVRRVALVTHAVHMRRAVAEFKAAGLEVLPAPTVFYSSGPNGEEFFDYIPSMTSAYAGWYALHEWLGIGAQRARPWLEQFIRSFSDDA